MSIDPRRAKFARILGYGATALVMAWSLLAVASYGVLGVAADWLGGAGHAEGWIAWGSRFLDLAGGTAVTILWIIGTLAILGSLAVIRRFVL